MNLPPGRLVHSRVVEEPGVALATALDRELTGYAVLEPQDALLLDADARGVLTFSDGVPELAEAPPTGRTGPDALAALAEPGPFSVELYEAPPDDLPGPAAWPDRTVPPAMPAERLAGDPALAARTRRSAPGDAPPESDPDRLGAVEAFLDDAAKIEALRSQARAEAERRAAEWDLSSELDRGKKGPT